MYKRISAATAVIILASAIIVFSARLLPGIVHENNTAETVIFQNDK